VDLPGALRVPDSLAALHPRLAPLVLGDGLLVAGAERLPLEHANPVEPLQLAREDEGQEIRGVIRRGGDEVEVGGDALAEDGAVQGVLVAEVVVEHPLVHGGRPGDRVHPGAGDALGNELAPGGAEDALAGSNGVSTRSNHLDTRMS
jgi:hypothetical protein